MYSKKKMLIDAISKIDFLNSAFFTIMIKVPKYFDKLKALVILIEINVNFCNLDIRHQKLSKILFLNSAAFYNDN